MKNDEQIAKRATSLAAGFLTVAGLLLMAIAVPVFSDRQYGPLFGCALFAIGCVILGLGALRSGQLDVIYEMRLMRATIADTTSNHAAPIGETASRKMD